ncbi:predicted protein [Pyrenophora tritici-repentis Pt-1C-BFP]|uniref:Uncharacterized protein n=1 Tax=Pyrenophora tritici-repentis (strain Pt-1C-BFP) TaxID=426418 RepID=B2WH08_PYRTR|nr:uncharacterized protein PTRG_09267 [Pyrenophora tritici-repentis Pt-1C-BFP]EDU42318.1 predicted protein [Pyrenophora tritici-repentis Pt-1C-BFP]
MACALSTSLHHQSDHSNRLRGCSPSQGYALSVAHCQSCQQAILTSNLTCLLVTLLTAQWKAAMSSDNQINARLQAARDGALIVKYMR